MIDTSSKLYYCVYWYPTIFHQEKEHRKIKPTSIDLSDKSIDKHYYLTIEEEKDPHKKDVFHLHYYLSKDRKELSELKSDRECISFVFHYISHSRNGFVVYSYDRENLVKSYWSQFEGNQIKDIKTYLTKLLKLQGNQNPTNYEIENYPVDRLLLSCYHHSKRFYHEHEVQKEADGKLEAYHFIVNEKNKRQYLTNKPELFPKNHDVINWFIDQFERQFVKYAKEVSGTYKMFSEQFSLLAYLTNNSPQIIDSQNKGKIDLLLTVLRWQSEVEQLKIKIDDELGIYKKFREKCLKSLKLVDIAEEIEEIKNLLDRIPDFRKKILQRRLKNLETICGNAMTEYAYCKTLIESKYNEKYDYTLFVTESEIRELIDHYERGVKCGDGLLEKDRCRKKAFNIRNCIRYIEGVRQKCTMWENDLSQELINEVKKVSDHIKDISQDNQKVLSESQKSSSLSELLAWISVMLGCFGIGFSLKDPTQDTASFSCKLWIPIIIGGVFFIWGLIKFLKNRYNDKKISSD